MIKQVIILRRDLNMRLGKSCSQIAHASMKVFFDRLYLAQRTYDVYDCEACKHIYNCPEQGDGRGDTCTNFITNAATHVFTPEMIEWKNGSFTKVVVGCGSEEELFQLQQQAEKAGVVNAIIRDNGNTEFKQKCPECNGEGELCIFDHKELDHDETCKKCNGTGKVNKPTYTCLAIGPDKSEKINLITAHLKLV